MHTIVGNLTQRVSKGPVQQFGTRQPIQVILLDTFFIIHPFQILKINLILASHVLPLHLDLLQMILDHPGIVLILDLLVHIIDQLGTLVDSGQIIPLTFAIYHLQFFFYFPHLVYCQS